MKKPSELYQQIQKQSDAELRRSIVIREISDQRAYLIREFDFSFEDAMQVNDPAQMIVNRLFASFDPRARANDTARELAHALSCSEDEVKVLAIESLQAWVNGHEYTVSLDESLDRWLMNECVKASRCLYEEALRRLLPHRAISVQATELELERSLSEVELRVLYDMLLISRLNLYGSHAKQLAYWLMSHQ